MSLHLSTAQTKIIQLFEQLANDEESGILLVDSETSRVIYGNDASRNLLGQRAWGWSLPELIPDLYVSPGSILNQQCTGLSSCEVEVSGRKLSAVINPVNGESFAVYLKSAERSSRLLELQAQTLFKAAELVAENPKPWTVLIKNGLAVATGAIGSLAATLWHAWPVVLLISVVVAALAVFFHRKRK